ncbi:putative short-chain dehydrogenase [Xylariales sp. PMI_506]|nr:putative short-chain dehydrogenase [Xylariales sp. PMI_506]
MPATTHPEFDVKTEALEVAKAFPENIRGKTVIITGVNQGGIGFYTAQAFASQSPAHLIVAGRSLPRLQKSIDALKADYPDVPYHALEIDLSSQKSVRAAAAELLSWSNIPVVDILVNNAAIMCIPERTINEDGIEITFATNHIGHFLFTCLIMPKLIKAAEGKPKGATRVVNVSSLSPTAAQMRWGDTNFDVVNRDLPKEVQPNYEMLKMWGTPDPESVAYAPIEGYNQSKVANVLFGIALTSRLYEKYGILSLALHPGIMETELTRNYSDHQKAAMNGLREARGYTYQSLGSGASTTLVAALDPKLGPGVPKNGKENYGAYLIQCQISEAARPGAVSSSEAERLWEMSEGLVKEEFAW